MSHVTTTMLNFAAFIGTIALSVAAVIALVFVIGIGMKVTTEVVKALKDKKQ